MRRAFTLTALVALVGCAALAPPGLAQGDGEDAPPPTELWQEYPLEESAPGEAPRRDPEAGLPTAEPSSESDDGIGATAIVLAVGLAALAFAAGWLAARTLRTRRGRAVPQARPEPMPVLHVAEPAEMEPTRAAVAPAPTPGPHLREAGGDLAIGYTTFAEAKASRDAETRAVARRLAATCADRGLVLQKVVGDAKSYSGPDLDRPGLGHALDRLSSGEASCLVVASLDQLSRSPAGLGRLIEWLGERHVRLVVSDIGLDTSTAEGRLAARTLVTVGSAERQKLDQRTRKGLEAARQGRRRSGRPAVADRPSLQRRIAEMRASGMTLQAIADTLNEEGVPTLRGGALWRPSSVQAAAGYKRPSSRAKPSSSKRSGNG
jgi:DNA invertase Pin-like site-specific DNA recombinase